MGKYVRDTEAAFVRMMANRTLRYTEQSKAMNEEYHDISAPTPVLCGYAVKLRHVPAAGGLDHVVEVYPGPAGVVIADATELASEVLAHPAKLLCQKDGHLEFGCDG